MNRIQKRNVIILLVLAVIIINLIITASYFDNKAYILGTIPFMFSIGWLIIEIMLFKYLEY